MNKKPPSCAGCGTGFGNAWCNDVNGYLCAGCLAQHVENAGLTIRALVRWAVEHKDCIGDDHCGDITCAACSAIFGGRRWLSGSDVVTMPLPTTDSA